MTTSVSQHITEKALSLGFTACGIAKARFLSDEKLRFENVLAKGYHAQMNYLKRDVEKRFSPALLLPNCQSVVVCLYHYALEEETNMKYRIARYAHLQDYHIFMKDKLHQLALYLHPEGKREEYKITVDTSPVSEKNWAVQAGLGVIGKNSLFRDKYGSYCFIGVILTTKVLATDDPQPVPDCGDCTLCMEACPTKAIETPYLVDANRCIAYHTIESKNENHSVLKGEWIFGCDVCQEICPHNNPRFINPDAVNQKSLFLQLQEKEVEDMDEEDFNYFFKKTSLERRQYARVKEEINRVKSENY